MTKRHITAAEVERDAQGYWTHPAMRAVDLETAADFSGSLHDHDDGPVCLWLRPTASRWRDGIEQVDL